MTSFSQLSIERSPIDIISHNIMSSTNTPQSGSIALTSAEQTIVQQVLNKLILVAKATEATHSGLGRQKKEGRSKVKSAVSVREANKRKKKEKQRREERERSRERTEARKASKSCKEGHLANLVLEKQGLVDSIVGANFSEITEAIERLADAATDGKSSLDSFEGLISKVCGEVESGTVNNALDNFDSFVKITQEFNDKFQPETIASLARSFESLSRSFTEDIPKRIDTLNENIGGLREDINNASWFEKILKKLNLGQNLDMAINISLYLSLFYTIVSGDVRPQMALALLSLAKAFLCGTSKFLPLVQVLSATIIMIGQKIPATNEDIEAQGGIEKTMYSIGIVGLCSLVLSIPWKRSEELVGRLYKMMPVLSRFDSAIKGMKSFIDYMLSGVQAVADWITNKLGVEKLEIKSDPYFFIEEYVAKVFRLRDQFTSGTRDQSVLYRANELYAEGQKVTAEARALGASDYQLRDIATCRNALDKIVEYLGSMNISTSGQRVPPVAVLLTGSPGIGKTTFANWAWPAVAAKTLPLDELRQFRRNRGSFVYSFNQKDSFYSGYRGQDHVLIDEFAFMKESNPTESIFPEIIMMINNNPYALNMAALEDKGRFYFRSKFIWMTTNRTTFNAPSMPSVQEAGAVLRRLDFSWMVCASKEYATESTKALRPEFRVLDRSKIKGLDSDFVHCRIHRILDLEKGTIEPDGITADEFVNLVVERYENTQNEGEAMLKMVDDTVERILLERLGEDLEKQGGDEEPIRSHDPHIHNKIRGCKCAICTKIPFTITAENFAESVGAKIRNGEVVLPRAQRNARVSVTRFDEIWLNIIQTLPTHIARLETFDSECIQAEALKDVEQGMALFCKYILNVRIHVSNMDFHNKNYLASKGWYVAYLAQQAVSFVSSCAIFYGLMRLFLRATQSTQTVDIQRPPKEAEIGYTARTHNKNARPIKLSRPPRNAQLGMAGLEDVGKSIVKKNGYRVNCVSQKLDRKYTAVITMVQSQVGLVPYHVMEAWVDMFRQDNDAYLDLIGAPRFDDVTQTYRNSGQKINLSDICQRGSEDDTYYIEHERVGGESEDCAVVYLPSVRKGTNITKHFLPSGFQISAGTFSCLFGMNKENALYQPMIGPCQYVANTAYEGCNASHSIRSAYVTSKGDCGSLVGIVSPLAPNAMYGIHVAGSASGQPTAYAIRVTREDLIDAIVRLKEGCMIIDDDPIENAPPTTKNFLEGQGGMGPGGAEPIAHIKPSVLPIHTNLTKSFLHGKIGFECKVEPAKLKFYQGYDALEHASNKYNVKTGSIPKHRLIQARYLVNKKFRMSMIARYRRILTVREAILGIDAEPFMKAIPRKTSPGLPWVHVFRESGKKSAIGEGELDFENPELKKVLEEVEWCKKAILDGKRPLFVFNSFLKDELRPFGKAPRLISSAPLHLAILIRQYFMGFIQWTIENRVANGIAVGINPMSEEWTLLARRHDAPIVFGGDIKTFDCVMSPEVMEQVRAIINGFYVDDGTTNHYIRNRLFDELIYSRHSFKGAIYEWEGCNASGNPLTITINCIVLLILIHAACIQAMAEEMEDAYGTKGEEWDRIEEALEGVEVTSYGDDSVTSSGDPSINFDNVRRILASWGITFTPEDKSDSAESATSIEGVSFLKRGFVKTHPTNSNFYVAALSLDSILNNIQWMRKNDHHYEDFKSKVETALTELSAHGETTYNFWQTKIHAAWNAACSVPLSYKPWRERFEDFLSVEMYL